MTARLSSQFRFLVISITDTGKGIPQAFLPSLFKAFSREDDSLTRQKDGLGLGLMVAKGIVRKMHGNLICVRSDTEGPNKGSEFEIRVPITPQDSSSMPGTPFARTPSPPAQNHPPNSMGPTSVPRSFMASTDPPSHSSLAAKYCWR